MAATSRLARYTLPALLLLATLRGHAAPAWQQPTEEELKMTSQPEVPGAPAVILFHEEITDDKLHSLTFYSRIKILNEAGREKYSNVALKYPVEPSWAPAGGYTDDDPAFYKIYDIAGRTIHSDGTVIPFTGKPFDRDVESSDELRLREKVFTLPDVQVGSIVEYRYTLRYDPYTAVDVAGDRDYVISPEWYVQTEIFARKQHFLWRTILSPVSFTAKIPEGPAAIARKEEVRASGRQVTDYELTTTRTMPVSDEAYMPPVHSFVQRVIFYSFQQPGIDSPDAFWAWQGKEWNRDVNSFIGSVLSVKTSTDAITGGAATPDEKLRRIYAAIMAMDNTRFSRAHSTQEDKESGAGKTKTAADTLAHKRGTDDQLTSLFVAMARAAGFKAYVMTVVNRDRNVFYRDWLSLDQFNDDIAIVELDGKEQFFDPGQRYCPYGQLLWMHTATAGLRQTEKGAEIATTPPGGFKDSQTIRIADLMMGADGRASGPITITYTGAPALEHRQEALQSDELNLRKELEDQLRKSLPQGAEATVESIENLQEYEKPLLVRFKFEGRVASPAGKHVLLPSSMFQAQEQPLFPSTKRENAVYFHFPERVADVVRFKLPAGWKAEAPLSPANLKFADMATYKTSEQLSGNSVTLRRDYILGSVVAFTREYPELRDFYSKVAANDQTPLVLQTTDASR